MVKQILVIDDEPDLRNLVQTCLEVMGGWHVITASSGKEGLAKVQVEKLDAILLDLMMPEMDGLATLKEIRSQAKTRCIPVVLLTARGRSLNQNEFAQFNIRGTIKKPFNPIKLAGQIEALLRTTTN